MLNILLSIISYDIWFYLSHILLHSKSLYRFHKGHHTKIYPRFLDTYTGHFLEGPFQGLGMLLPFFYLNYNIYDILIVLSFLNIR